MFKLLLFIEYATGAAQMQNTQNIKCAMRLTKLHRVAISFLNPNYDVINDVISDFAKVVVERCGFHHWIAQRISWGEVVSIFSIGLHFLYLL